MVTSYHSLLPDTPISEAVRTFKEASDREGRKIFGMMVIDNDEHLCGILSMYDILLSIQPRYVQVWGEMDDIDVTGLIDNLCYKSQSILVEDIMTKDVITIDIETHLFMVLEVMNRKHIRRLPVTAGEHVAGIIYISDLFHYLLGKLQT